MRLIIMLNWIMECTIRKMKKTIIMVRKKKKLPSRNPQLRNNIDTVTSIEKMMKACKRKSRRARP
jgi:hypothetical protein